MNQQRLFWSTVISLAAVSVLNAQGGEPFLPEKEPYRLGMVLPHSTFPAGIAVQCRQTAWLERLNDYPVDNIIEGKANLFVTREEFNQLTAEFEPQLARGEMTITITETNEEMERNLQDRSGNMAYHTYDTIVSELKGLQSKHGNICKMHELGTATGGGALKIYGFKVSSNVDKEEDKPSVYLCAAIHGNEKPGPEVIMYTINQIVNNYSSDPAMKSLVDNTQLWFVPVVNPHGYKNNSRANGNNVDLNRDYPSSWPARFDETRAQPETAAILKFIDSHHHVAGVDYHTFGKMTMLPWAYTTSAPTDQKALKDLGSQMASPNGHRVGSIASFVGVNKGSTADYYYGKYGVFAYGVELGNAHAPSTSALETLVQNEHKAAMALLKRVHTLCVTGKITNSKTGSPVKATVMVSGLDKASGDARNPMKSNAVFGRYYRMLTAGTYSITYSAPGYTSQTKNNVAVNDQGQTVVDVALEPSK